MDEVSCLGFSNLFNLFTSSQVQDQALLCILVRLDSSTSHTCPAFSILCVPAYPSNMHAFVHSFNSYFFNSYLFSSVQSLNNVWLFVTPWTTARQTSLSITNSRSLLKLMSIESVMPSNHPLSSPSPPAFNLSQHQGLFQWVPSLHQVAKVLEFWLWHQSFQWTPRIDPLGWTGWISLQSKGLPRVFSNTTVQKHQFFSAQLSL